MDDLISRQNFDKCLEDAEKESVKNRKYVLASALNTIRGNLRNFPSAQPELGKNSPSEQHKMDKLGVKTEETCTDTISRQAAIDTVFKFLGKREIARTIQTALWILPSAQPEIIRCEDCKHYEADIMGNPWGVCCHPDWITDNCGNLVDESGWCYRAERRTE